MANIVQLVKLPIMHCSCQSDETVPSRTVRVILRVVTAEREKICKTTHTFIQVMYGDPEQRLKET